MTNRGLVAEPRGGCSGGTWARGYGGWVGGTVGYGGRGSGG